MRTCSYRLTAALLLLAASAISAVDRIDTVPLPPAPNAAPAQDAPTSRGELLYENHCMSCHTSIAHVRDNRRAKSAAEVGAWVRRWATELKLGWTDADIAAVTRHLNKRYYKFDATAAARAELRDASRRR